MNDFVTGLDKVAVSEDGKVLLIINATFQEKPVQMMVNWDAHQALRISDMIRQAAQEAAKNTVLP